MSFFKTVGAVAVGLSVASASGVAAEELFSAEGARHASQRVECRRKKAGDHVGNGNHAHMHGRAHGKVGGRKSNLALIAESFKHSKRAIKNGLASSPEGISHLGAGFDLSKLHPFDKAFKDGYSHVACLNEGMRKGANLHEDPNSYSAQNLNISVVFYDTMVEEEDREPMTHDVCFNYCRTLENMNFFGLLNGRDCYCTPYFKAEAGGEDQICDMPCDGNPATMCGGTDKSDMFEMHMCLDTREDLLSAIDRGRELMARLYEPTENLGSSASVLQYIGSMAQVYSGQAGDSLAGNQAQEVKGVAGENFVLVRESVKAYLQLKDVTLQMEGMVAGSDFSKASDAKAADSLLRAFGKVAIVIADEIKRVKFARNQLAGYRGYNHSDSLPSYKEFSTYYLGYKQKLNREDGTFKAQGSTIAEVDSVCNGKKLLRTLQGGSSDCAYQCDMTIHPNKCVAFQHYDLVGYHTDEEDSKPNFVMCQWWGVNNETTGGQITEEGDCDFITMQKGRAKNGGDKHTASVTGATEYDYAYGDFIVEGPIDLTFDVAEGEDSCFVTWWSEKEDFNYVYKACAEDVVAGEEGLVEVYLEGKYQKVTPAKLKDQKFHFEEGSHLLESNFYGNYAGGPVKFKATKRAGKTTGVCALFADLNSVSYYTCPEDDRNKMSNPGKNAQCMVKVSEGMGILEAFKKVNNGMISENKRCMITKEHNIPEYQPFDFVGELKELSEKKL